MISKVVVFEDTKKDQDLFRARLEEAGCQVLVVDTHRAEDRREEILGFAPDGAVVDSRFRDSDVDGAWIVAFLHKHVPDLPIVVCSILGDSEAGRERLSRTYGCAPGVRGIIGKSPFPEGRDLIRILGA